MKITDKLLEAHKEVSSPATFSFEFFTPKTTQGVQNLYDRMDRMYDLNPLFIDITWNAGGKLSTLTSEMVHTTSTVLGLETCMHLTCTNMKLEVIDQALKSAYESGCQNILALRGDPPLDGSDSTGDFKYAKDLIKHIRKQYGDHFNIGIAAYPEGQPEESDRKKTLQYLKEKQDAGGDFIVTQMFYDVEHFINWAHECRELGITIPIVPGIMPISTYAAFLRRAGWSEINIPQHFHDRLSPIKEDDAKVREEGTKLLIEMCQQLLDSQVVNHLHFYTMNLEKSTLMILQGLNLITKQQINDMKKQPWRKSLNPTRSSESVRPIFWKNRKFSYIQRTSNWDEFPNGRWGDSRSPAFGSIELCDSELIRHSPKKAIELWGKPTSLKQLADLTIQYLEGEMTCLPWSDGRISQEITSTKPQLIELNSANIVTINSQPSIDGLKSNDIIYGWGPKDGYIYQKQYLEFVIPSTKLDELISRIDKLNATQGSSDYNILSYYAANIGSDSTLVTNTQSSDINAVTWGCFPGKEVVQPTIVEKISFLAWKDEFFSILKKWQAIFRSEIKLQSDDEESKSAIEFLETLHDDFSLVNIVDNDYVNEPNTRIFELLKGL
ncbi:hypothetical protein CANARDRAFT_6702 [[Candida] arabinofermentans NRRL YB-2248]|uniref:MTHFR SAM-binding regulatory domain-containing protein n=1 Tax=[Candida] arabinofermentans NRRL YB-2248 TaxID=983967 RepID=A0A1E4T374_9ASCO|nr:hypothetical protein CANARDRAFT_6702 [[Candida] arabinofermentans NRRL YB-2248]